MARQTKHIPVKWLIKPEIIQEAHEWNKWHLYICIYWTNEISSYISVPLNYQAGQIQSKTSLPGQAAVELYQYHPVDPLHCPFKP